MDIIYIKNENNEQIPYEAVTIFNISGSKYNYIIYRSQDKSKYYIAKYLGDKIVNLDTNLTESELNFGNSILKGMGII